MITTNEIMLIYAGQVTAFSLCLLWMGHLDRTVLIWLVSNLFGAIGVILITREFSVAQEAILTYGGMFTIWSSSLKAVALAEARVGWRYNRAIFILIILALAFSYMLIQPRFINFRLAALSLAGICTLLAILTALFNNRKWTGLRGQRLLGMALIGGITIFALRLMSAYPIGHTTRFIGSTTEQIIGAASIVVISLIMQVAFIGMASGRRERVHLFAEHRMARSRERARLLKDGQIEALRLATERLNMLNLLTHEVRQPLNNAQAALQLVLNDMSENVVRPDHVKSTARRIQIILDEIVLTLSNSITAATLIERGEGRAHQPVEVRTIANFAMLDCPAGEQSRVRFHAPHEDLFLIADPVLLRLSLRNLLDNALKYSPLGSLIDFTISVDDDRFGIAFSVTNTVSDTKLLIGDLIPRGNRGMGNHFEGFGLGLYIVNEAARLHHGSLSFSQAQPDQVTFELFLPH